MDKASPIDPFGYSLIGLLLLFLLYAGYLSYKSIDWTVLTRLESQKLVLPTPIIAPPATPSAN
jgi:hypothetical protein